MKHILDVTVKISQGLFIILFLITIVTSCDKEDPNEEPTEPLIADFPNEIGYKWIYFRYDSSTYESDTIVVEIVGQTKRLNEQPVSIWQYNYNTYIETVYVCFANDTVFYYNDLNTDWPFKIYIFPLLVENSWGNSMDTSIIVSRDQVSVAAGTFQYGYNIKRSIIEFNYFLSENIWYVPKVGEVKISRKEYLFDNVTWELISFNF